MNQKKLKLHKVQRLKKRFNSLNLYLKYSIIFFLIILVGLLPIEIKNGSFLFSGLFVDRSAGIDGLKQHLVFMNDYISHIKEGLFNGGISLYRFDVGLGSDMINHYSYYSLFDPLLIIAYLIPLKYIEISYYILIFVRIFLSGIASILLAKKLGIKKDKALLAVGISYAFNVAILFSAFRHPMFINGPLYLALILYGYEKIKRNESHIPLILSVFFALISQFYIFIYITFGFVLFTFIDLYKDLRNKKFKKYIKVNLYYLLGVMLGGFILVTQLMATMDGARIGSKGYEFYHAIDYAVLILSNFIPLAGDHYTAGIGNFFVFIICLFFIINEKKKSTYSKFFLILFGLSFLAVFSYLINATSYVVNRWMFLITLPASIIVGKYIEEGNFEEISISKLSKVFSVLVILAISFLAMYLVSVIFLNNVIVIIFSILIFGIGIIISIKTLKSEINFKLFKKILTSNNLYKYVIYNSIVVLLIVSGIYCFILTPKDALNTYYGSNDLYSNVLINDEFYRVEESKFVAGVSDYSNDGIYYGYPSTASYNTMTNGNIIDILLEYNVINHNNSVGYNGFNFRTRFMAVNHVKYVIIRESEQKLPPYGFSFYKQVKVPKYDSKLKPYHQGGNILKDDNGNVIYEYANIYQNEIMLNFGVVYDSYLTTSDLKDLASVEKEALLTSTIVLETETSEVSKYNINDEIQQVIVEDYRLENIVQEGSRLIVSEGGVLSFVIPKLVNSELYIELNGLENIDKNLNFTTIYSTRDYIQEVKNYGYASNMYIENKDHLVNLGYYDDASEVLVQIQLEEGTYEFDKLGYYLVDLSNLETEINSLNENYLSDLEFNNSGFTGKIKTNKKGYMFLSIPYSKGFKAYIDGEEVEILRANTGYMSVFVQEGDEVLEVKYSTPGLEIGLYISIISLIIFVLIILRYILDKITVTNQTNNNEEKNEKNSRIYK